MEVDQKLSYFLVLAPSCELVFLFEDNLAASQPTDTDHGMACHNFLKAREMSAAEALQQEIKQQGELVKSLKAEKKVLLPELYLSYMTALCRNLLVGQFFGPVSIR